MSNNFYGFVCVCPVTDSKYFEFIGVAALGKIFFGQVGEQYALFVTVFRNIFGYFGLGSVVTSNQSSAEHKNDH